MSRLSRILAPALVVCLSGACVQPIGLEPVKPPRGSVHGRFALGQVLERRRDVQPETEDEASGWMAGGGAFVALDPDDPRLQIGFEIDAVGSDDDVFPSRNAHEGLEGFAYVGLVSGDGDPWRVTTRLGFVVGSLESEPSQGAGNGGEWDYWAPFKVQTEPTLEVLRRQDLQVMLYGTAGGSVLTGDGRVAGRSSELLGVGYDLGAGVRVRFEAGPFVSVGYTRRGYLFDDDELLENALTEALLEFQGVTVTSGFRF